VKLRQSVKHEIMMTGMLIFFNIMDDNSHVNSCVTVNCTDSRLLEN